MGERGTETLQVKTANSFGYEWQKFHDYYAAYECNFWESVYPVTPEDVKDKIVLDAGCGAGRNAITLSQYAFRVTGFDIASKAVQVAIENTKDKKNVRIFPLSIYQLPYIWWQYFDYVFCIGTLHHLPDPQAGFNKLVTTLKPGGVISIWVYGQKDNKLAMKVYEPIRKVTTRIPHAILYRLSWFPAVFVQLCNALRLPLFKHYSQFPFRTKWNDAFDMLSAPSAEYYSLEEIREWYENAGLKDVRVEYRMMGGKAKGIRGYGVKK